MFVGRSEEEQELAGEEMGWSWNPLSAIKSVFSSPAANTATSLAAAGILGPQAALALKAAQLVAQSQGGKQAPAPAPLPKVAAKGGQPAAAGPGGSAAAGPTKAAGGAVAAGWSFMGGYDTHSDDHINTLINRERDPDKRQRMVMSHERAKRMRSVSAGSGMSEVEEAIGELYARIPVDAQGKPFLDANAVKAIALHMSSKSSGGRPTKNGAIYARKMIATYAKMNNIATPGLKLVRK